MPEGATVLPWQCTVALMPCHYEYKEEMRGQEPSLKAKVPTEKASSLGAAKEMHIVITCECGCHMGVVPLCYKPLAA